MSGRDQEKKKETVVGPIPKEPQGKYVIAEIPTQTDLIIMKRGDNKETYNLLTAVCKIMNDVEELKKKCK